jgi:hypothetical protein
MSEVRVNNLSNENNTGGPTISGITTYSGRHFFVPPQGDTASRPSDCEPGSLRFNTDSAKLEYFRGNTIGWTEIEAELTAPLGGGTGSNAGLGNRAVIFGGYITGSDFTNTMDFVTISTLGNAQDFGDSIATGFYQGGAASRTRGYMMGGQTPGSPNGVANIDTMVFSSTGNATDYGDLTQAAKFVRSISNSTRAVANLGSIGGTGLQNVLEYINMDSTGSTVDFGDLTNIHYTGATTQSSIRGFFQGGQDSPSSPYYTNMISAITTASLGTYEDWGDLLTQKSNYQAGFGNATRGIDAGGADQPYTGYMNTIQYYSVVTAGNAVNFGDLSTVHENITGTSDSTRGIIASGQSGGSSHNVIEYIQISTTGDAKDFGDLTVARMGGAACSNAHGGL